MLTITLKTYRRPDYTKQVLDALSRCIGIERCTLLTQCEPDFPGVLDVVERFTACENVIEVNHQRAGLNANTFLVLTRARAEGGDVLHIEDDTVLSPDALVYFKWALDYSRGDGRVWTVSGYNKPRAKPTPDQLGEVRYKPWFTCWGWACSEEVLHEMLTNWCFKNPKSFAWRLQKLRGNRMELHPQLSRVQNIGFEMGENGRDPKWYRENHAVPWVADCKEAAYHVRDTR